MKHRLIVTPAVAITLLALGCTEEAYFSQLDASETDALVQRSAVTAGSPQLISGGTLCAGESQSSMCAAVMSKKAADNGFSSPLFGLATAPNGDVLVADGGAGVASQTGALEIALPGVTDINAIGRSSLWATSGALGDAETDTGQGLYRLSQGTARKLVNLFEFEQNYDPDGGEHPDSNPFDVASLGGSAALVADAGGNDLLRVNNRGEVHVLAVFPDELVSTVNAKDLADCSGTPIPDLAFLCDLPPTIPAQAVPTSVAVGPDGYFYVGELKGFPAPVGESNIWRVSPHASWAICGSSPDCVKVFDGGFTSIIDLNFGPDGHLYVAELDERSWGILEFLGTATGGSINSCDVSALTCNEVATGIPILTAIAVGNDGSVWATRNALIPGLAGVVQIQ